MNTRKSINVSRNYKPAPNACMRAVELLLEKFVKEGGPNTASDNGAKSSKGGNLAR
jgi:hypothetical protein